MASQPAPSQQLSANLECSLHGILASDTLPALLDRLVAICGDLRRGIIETPDFEEHEIIMGQALRSTNDGTRLDDTMARIKSSALDSETGQRVLDLDKREWRLSHYGNPDPRNANCVVRPVYTAPIRGRVLDFMSALGFGFVFEYFRKGYYFYWDQAVKVTVTQTYTLPNRMDVSSANPFDAKYWVVEAVGKPVPLAEVPNMERRLKVLQGHLAGLVELRVPDPKVMQQRLPP